MRPTWLMLFGMLSACDGWPAQPADGTGSTTSTLPDASNNCTWLATLNPNAPPEVSGAFCFGVALGASEYLACSPINASDVQCADSALGVEYLVRWTGSQGTVLGTGAAPLGVINQGTVNAFGIQVTSQLQGVCTINANLSRAEFCASRVGPA